MGSFSIYEQPKYKPNLILTLTLTQILTLKPTWVDATICSHFGCSYIEKEPQNVPLKPRNYNYSDHNHKPLTNYFDIVDSASLYARVKSFPLN